MSTHNLWNDVKEAARGLLGIEAWSKVDDRPFGKQQEKMNALCAAVLTYGKATRRLGYADIGEEPKIAGKKWLCLTDCVRPESIWHHLTDGQRADLARFVLAEVDQGPAGVVEGKTLWLEEMSAAQIFEAMDEEQRDDFDKMFCKHLVSEMTPQRLWNLMTASQKTAIEGDRFASIEQRLAHGEAADGVHARRIEAMEKRVRDLDKSDDMDVLGRLGSLEERVGQLGAIVAPAGEERRTMADLDGRLTMAAAYRKGTAADGR